MDSEIHTRQQHRRQAAGRGGKLAGDAAVTEASACPLVDVSPGGCIPGMKHANQVCFITRPSQGLWPWRGRTILGAAASLGRGRCLEGAMAVVCEWGEPLTTAPTAGHALSSTGRVPHAGPELLEGSARWAVAPQPSFGARPSVELQSVPSSVSSQEGPNRVPPGPACAAGLGPSPWTPPDLQAPLYDSAGQRGSSSCWSVLAVWSADAPRQGPLSTAGPRSSPELLRQWSPSLLLKAGFTTLGSTA